MTFKPTSEAELAEMIVAAQGPLSIRGGNTRGLAPEQGEVLETGGLSGVTLYEPGALTLVVQAGTPLAEVEALLAGEGQRLAFEPMDHRPLLGTTGAPTIGGVVAANVSGPRRIQAGAARDFMLGLRFVDGAGTVLRNGGRVMKNVTGLDLVRLLTGSQGTLGVISEVSLKVLPRPEAAACLCLDGLEIDQAVRVMAQALGSPFEVTGAAHVPVGREGAPVTLLRIEGFEGSVAYRIEALRTLLGLEARVARDPDEIAADWALVRDVRAFDGLAGDVWRISCKPTEAPELAQRMCAERAMFDWGGGLIWALSAPGTNLRERLGRFDGHATRVRGAGPGAQQPQSPAVAALASGLRARFDPKGLFAPALTAA